MTTHPRFRKLRYPHEIPVSEDHLYRLIIRYGMPIGLRIQHQINGQALLPGWPDLTIIGPGGIAMWELKSITGELSALQKDCARVIRSCPGVQYSVVTPLDWASGSCQAALDRLATEPPEAPEQDSQLAAAA